MGATVRHRAAIGASPPTKAFILAAGLGTRMRPLSTVVPKPLLPLWGVPNVLHLLKMLQSWGVRDVLLNLHHEPGAILACLRQHSREGLRLNFTFEPEILGTGGALAHAHWFLDEPFWLLNADVAAVLNPAPLWQVFHARQALAAVWLEPERGPRTVETDAKGRIQTFQSPTPGAPGTATFCGLHLVNPRILRYIPPRGFSSIIDAYTLAHRQGEWIAGISCAHSFWADLGTPEQYISAHRELLRRHRSRLPGGELVGGFMLARARVLQRAGLRIKGFAAVGAGVATHGPAQLEDVVLWDGAHIEPGACLHELVAGEQTRLQGDLTRVAIPAGQALTMLERNLIRPYGLAGDKATAQFLSPRGSARSFIRVCQARRSIMLVRHDPTRAENNYYAAHSRFLAKLGIPVPQVLAEAPAQQATVFEDLGNASLESCYSHMAPSAVRRIYRQVLDAVLCLHVKGTRKLAPGAPPLMPAFSAQLYAWERDYFDKHVMQEMLRLPARLRNGARAELDAIAQVLLREPPTLIHRDLQSSNVLLKNGHPYLIDFQGMRLGAALYDLASLLCDPYVSLPDPLRDELLEYYTARQPGPADRKSHFWLAAIERLCQALGAFACLSAKPATAAFARHLEPGARMLAQAVEYAAAYPYLQRVASRLRQTLAPGRRGPRPPQT